MKFFNRAKLATSYFLGYAKARGMPLEASIEITTDCNLTCTMCPRKKINRPVREMKLPVFTKIIESMKGNAELVYLHGLGEPLLNKNLIKMIKIAKKAGLKVGISTNATLMDKKRSVGIINSGLDYLIFALDGATAETYQKIRVGGNFQKVEQNIKDFLQLKKEKGESPFTIIQFIVMKENEQEADLFLHKWRHSGADVIRTKPVVDFFNQKNRSSLIKKCIYPYRMINIYYDGSVVPCCEDNFSQYCLGNIRNKSLAAIWNDLPARNLRRRLAKGDRKSIPLCRHCHYPQPSALGVLGLMLFDNLKVKKILPLLERWPIFRRMIFYD